MHLSRRRQLLRWSGWFFFINTLFSLAIQLGYLHLLPDLHAVYGATTGRVVLAWSFLIASYVTQAALINYLCCALVLIGIWLWPRYGLTAVLSVLLSALVNLGQILDVVTFRLFHTHNVDLAVTVFKAKAFSEVFPVSSTEVALGVFVFAGFALLEAAVAYGVWRYVQLTKSGVWGRWITGFLLLVALFSYGVMASILTFPVGYRLNEHNSRLLLKVARFVPFYNELYTTLVPGSERFVRHMKTQQGSVALQLRAENRQLHYPKTPIQCVAKKRPLNIVWVVIDTWRYDAMNPTVTPNIAAFADKTVQFDRHYSGGNCTQSGIFSLFYGLPANYWQAMLQQKKSPVFLNTLQQQNYQLGIFASATLRFPQFDKTVFSQVDPLPISTPGESSIARDRVITQRFKKFIARRDEHRPFFSFVFYDTGHNYCGGGATANQSPFQPAIEECKRFDLNTDTDPQPYINRYHNAIHFIDGQVGQLLETLSKKHLLDDTIVMITADHGEEFDDEKLNYWSHASAYTPYQLHVPFLLWWPGHSQRVVRQMTSHYDLVPSLMHQVLGCQTPAEHYSLGGSLWRKRSRDYLLAASYSDYAVVTPREIVRIYPDGDYVINYPNGHHKAGAQLNADLMRSVFHTVTRFFKPSDEVN